MLKPKYASKHSVLGGDPSCHYTTVFSEATASEHSLCHKHEFRIDIKKRIQPIQTVNDDSPLTTRTGGFKTSRNSILMKPIFDVQSPAPTGKLRRQTLNSSESRSKNNAATTARSTQQHWTKTQDRLNT